jgi:trigger factor
MQVSVEKTGDLERRMTVQVPAEDIESQISGRLNTLRGQVRLKGFRPGKVPMNVLRQRYGQQVRDEVLGELMQQRLQQAIGEQAMRVAGITRLEPSAADDAADQSHFSFIADLEIFPELPELDVSDIKIERPVVEVTESDVDDMLETLREQRGDWEKVERAAAKDDRVKIAYVARVGDERVPEMGEHELTPRLGRLESFPALEKALMGASAGDEQSLELTFPENYRQAKLAGKTAQVELKIKSVEAPKLPTLDDAFAESFGIEGGLSQMRQDVRRNLEREMRQTVTNRLKERVTEALLTRFADLPLPKTGVQQEAQQMKAQLQQQQQQAGQRAELPLELFMEGAERRLRLGLLMAELARQHDVKIDADRVTARLEEIAETYDSPAEVIEMYRNNAQAMDQIENMVLEEQVLDLVTEEAQVTDQAMTFKALMEPA